MMSLPKDNQSKKKSHTTHSRRESREQRQKRIARKVALLPTEPGCYLMRDANNRIFYIGKAQNLRSRVRSYFSGSDARQFVAWLDDLLFELDVIVVHSEKEALLLERTLIREHSPRFNVLLTDDKNFIHLRLQSYKAENSDLKNDSLPKKRIRYPRLEVVRNPRDDGAKYFGPYHSASALRQSLSLINRHFGLRTCSDSVLENRKRACLQYQIGRCPAPCVKEVSDYSERTQDAAMHLDGRGKVLEKRLQKRMWEAAQNESFEKAARLRDQLVALKSSRAKQVVSDVQRRRNQDVFGVLRLGSQLEICRVQIRDGQMRSSETFPFDEQEFPTAELVSSFVVQLYSRLAEDDPQKIPDEILFTRELQLEKELASFGLYLSEQKKKRVRFFAPARGQLQRLVSLAEKNAQISLSERLRKEEAHEKALAQLQKRMQMTRLPKTIECFDVSIFQGTDAVASQICFVDGIPAQKNYRIYNIKTVEGTDDYRMLYEALSRRLNRGLKENNLPDLLIVDGGKGQLNVAQAVCRDLKIPTGGNGLYLAGLAKARTLDEKGAPKRNKNNKHCAEVKHDSVPEEYAKSEPDEVKRTAERLFIPGVKDGLLLKSHTKERYLLEQLRDEAHRFAITHHRKRRKKRTLRSALDDIPGIGTQKRRNLLQHFGSIAKIKKATLAELTMAPGMGKKLAAMVKEHLQNET